MLGKQIQIKNITLCNKCHTELHRERGGFSSIGKHIKMNKIKEMKRKKEKEIELQKKKKEKELQKKEEELKKLQKIKELKEYLETLVGKKLHKEEQKELAEKLNIRRNGRLQKSYSKLNIGLEMLKLPFIILPKRTNSKRYWVIIKDVDK